MRSKATIYKGILVALAITLVPVSAISAQKIIPGSTCKVLKQKTVYLNKTYTCVKSGMKLVWDKGVVLVKPTPTPTPTPTSTPTPTPSPTPTSTPTPTPTPIYPAEPTSFDDLIENYKGIAYAAWSKSSGVINSSNATSPAIKMITGPNTKLRIENPSTIFDLIARLYPGYGPSKDFTVLSFGYDDREWAQVQLNTLPPKDPTAIGWVAYTGCDTRQTCLGGNMFTGDKGQQLLVLVMEVCCGDQVPGMLEAHEYTHGVQQNQMKFAQPWPPSDAYPPVWLHEGGAHFSQNVVINYQSFDKYLSFRRDSASNIFNDSKITSQWIQEYLGANPDLTWYRKYDRWTMFVMGAMFIEALVAIKGPESTMEVWKLAGTGLKFSQAFEKVYGISFEKALPIISKAIALELGRS